MANVSSADILAVLQALPQGGTRTQILEKLGNPFSGRQLSRYLAPLEKVGRIRTERAGKEVLYFVGETRREAPEARKDGGAEAQNIGGAEGPKSAGAEPSQTEDRGQTADGAGQPSGVKSQTADGRDQKPEPNATAGLTPAGDGASPAESTADKPVEAAAKPMEPAANDAGTATGIDPDFPDMAEVVALDVVLGGLTKPAAVLLLKKAAQEYHKEGAAVMAFVRYALQRIDRITPEEVEDLGVDPEQFAEWQRRWAGDYGYSQDPASAPGSMVSVQGSTADAIHGGDTKAERERPSRDTKPGSSKEKGTAKVGTHPVSTADRLPEVPMSEAALRTSTSAMLVNALTDWLGRWMPRLTRSQRAGVAATVGALMIVLYQSLNRYKWLALGVPVVGALGLLLFGGNGGHGATRDQRPGTGDRGSAEESNRTEPSQTAAIRRTSGQATVETRDERPATKSQSDDRKPEGADVPVRRRVRGWHFLWAAAGLALVAGGAWYLWLRPSAAPPMLRPPEAAVREYLVKNAGPLPVRLADLRVTYGNATETNCRLSYEARFETTEPLFRRIDANEYLRTHYAAELATIEAATALRGNAKLETRNAETTPQLPAFPPVLVTTQTPPGTSVAASGTLVAWKHDTTWIFTGDPVRLDRSTLAGDPKPAGALAVDLPEDAARLQALIADRVAYAAKVQAAAKALAEQRARDVQQRKAAFSELLRGGTLFTGVVNDPTKHQPQRFVLEITAATGSQLNAVLRNEGGWADVRPFQGEWTVDADGQVATVTLRTASTAALDGAGPLLQDRMDWGLAFALHADGSGTELETRNAKLENGLNPQSAVPAVVQTVDASSVAELRADWTRGLAAVLAATRAGALYRGTALSKIYRTTQTVWLRFGGTERPGAAALPGPIILDATIAAAANGSGGRAFRGTIIANTYRAGANPIRLQSADTDRIAGADGHTVLGVVTGAGLTMTLRLDADRLVGEDGWFVYEFAPDAANAGPETRDQGPGTANATGSSSGANAPAGSSLSSQPSTLNPGASAPALPPFPTAGGAYGLVGGRWVALPTNHPQAIRKDKRILDGLFSAIEAMERKMAGQPPQPPEQIWGVLTFDGRDDVPWLPADGVVLCYVGELKPVPPERLKKYPALQLEPPMELGMLQTMAGGSRSILVTAIYPDIPGFGPRHIEATVEQRPPHVVLLRCPGPLPVGRYAVTCNDQAYELGVVAN